MPTPPHDPSFDPFSPEPVRPPAFGPPARPLPPPPPGRARPEFPSAATRPVPPTPPRPAPSVAPGPAQPPHGRPPQAFPAAAPTRAAASPATVFGGSYALGGVAALLVSTAIALLASIPNFRAQQGGPPGFLLVGGASGLVVLAAAVVSLGVLDERGRGWARVASWVVCGLAVGAAAAVLVFDPARKVAWFAGLLQLGAVVTIAVAVAAAVLLALPPSNRYFGHAPRTEPAAAQAFPPPAFAQPPAAAPPPAHAPRPDHDFDPFS